MKIRLELMHKNARVKKVVLKADTIIGRSTECGLRIASNEVSRQHCKICLGDGSVTVRDLGSSNGTFVNGYQLEEQTDYEIAPDSELSVGGIKFIVRFEEPKSLARQTDGLGSTIDLKPATHGSPEETKRDPTQAVNAALEETVNFDSAQRRESEADAPDETTETVARDAGEWDLSEEEADVELEALGDSAILERDAESSQTEPDPEPLFPGIEPEPNLDQDSSLGEFFQKFD